VWQNRVTGATESVDCVRFYSGCFTAALLTFGIDRIMFSVDYPYSPNTKGRAFLDRLSLAPADMAKLSHSNADKLLKLRVEQE